MWQAVCLVGTIKDDIATKIIIINAMPASE